MKREIKGGATNQTIDIFVLDSSATDGSGLTGLTDASSGLVCYYRRGATGSSTQLTLASQTVGGAHTDGGFVQIDATNMPGVYRVDLSDAVVATGVPYVTVMLKGATNMAPVVAEIVILDYDPEQAAADLADKYLGRNIAGGSDGGRDVTSTYRAIRNRHAISGGTLTVYQENDSTSAWTATVTTAAGDPISEIDPA